MKTKAEKGPGRIKSAVLNWLGFSFTDIEQWRSLYGRESDSGETVSLDTVTRLSTVMACTRLIAQRISTLPFNLYRRTGNDDRELARKHPLNRLLSLKPNAKMTAPLLWEAVVASMLLQRGAFLEKVLNGAGDMSSIGFLHPLRISLDHGAGKYRYIEKDGSPRFIDQKNVVYIPAFTTDGETGVSVIEYGIQTLGNALAADKAAANTFKKGLHPTTYFKYPKILKKEQRAEAREAIETLSGAANAGKPIVLEADMDVGSIGIDPKDAQLLESRQVSAEEVCSLFGVPPTMIGRGDKASSWASSSENLNLWFLNYTLLPWMIRIATSVTTNFLSPVEQLEYYAEHNIKGMLQGDSAARSQFYSTALQNGWMNRNQVARLENQPTFDGGDIYTVQSNLIPIDKLGQTDSASALRSALANFFNQEHDNAT